MSVAKSWKWYMDSALDWMIANPGRPLYELAAHLNRTPSWVSLFIKTDMFKMKMRERRAEFQEMSDLSLVTKLHQVADKGLDIMLERMEKKREQIPINLLHEITSGTLAKLGYGAPSVSPVQVNVGGPTIQPMIAVPVSASELAEARMALRQVEQKKLSGTSSPILDLLPIEKEPEQTVEKEEKPRAAFTIST